MPIRELKHRPLSPALQQYKELFGHLPAVESLKFLSTDDLEAKALAAVEEGQPVESWKKRGSIKMGTNLDGFYDQKY